MTEPVVTMESIRVAAFLNPSPPGDPDNLQITIIARDEVDNGICFVIPPGQNQLGMTPTDKQVRARVIDLLMMWFGWACGVDYILIHEVGRDEL